MSHSAFHYSMSDDILVLMLRSPNRVIIYRFHWPINRLI